MTSSRPVSLAQRIKELRDTKGLTLEDLAAKAEISKTYLWELEKDVGGLKKPSADVLLRIATALSTTIADLLSLPSITVNQKQVAIPPALHEFQRRMEALKTPLTPKDLRELAALKFRGGQPQTVDEWHSLYLVFAARTRKPEP